MRPSLNSARMSPTLISRPVPGRPYCPASGSKAAEPSASGHDLCLYGLDIASQLWCALYLQPARTTGLLSAQAEYQVRILPAIAAQLAAETARCGHNRAAAYPGSPR